MIQSDMRVRASRTRALRVATAVALCAGAAAHADLPADQRAAGGVTLVSQHVIAGGGVSRARSACFDLAGTVAEPVAGSAQGGGFTLDAGFLAAPVSTDAVFRTSFEVCQS